MRSRVETRAGFDAVEVDRAQIGQLSRFDRSNGRFEAECRGGIERCHSESRVRRHGGGVQCRDLGQQCRLSHLREHVEAIVACGPVGAEPDPDTRFEQARYRCDTAGKLHVGCRAVRDAAVVASQQFDIRGIEVHCMYPDEVAAENAEPCQARQRTRAELCHGIGHFLRRFMNVDMNWAVEFGRNAGDAHEGFVRYGVGRVRRDREADPWMGQPFVACAQPFAKVVVSARGIGCRKVQHRHADHGAHAGLAERLRSGVWVEIHVVAGRDSAAKHLRCGEQGAVADECPRHVLALRWPDRFLEPAHQGKIVRNAAHQGHRGMRVQIDQAGHEYVFRQINAMLGRELTCRHFLRQDRHDGAAPHGDRMMLEYRVGRLDRDDPAGVDEQIDGILHFIAPDAKTPVRRRGRCRNVEDQLPLAGSSPGRDGAVRGIRRERRRCVHR